jgi:hypothetical protein
LAPEIFQVPVPVLRREVLLVPELSTMMPWMSLAAVLSPVSVRVFRPAPVAVKAGAVNSSGPEPEASRVAPPVVPARSMIRSVEARPAPV